MDEAVRTKILDEVQKMRIAQEECVRLLKLIRTDSSLWKVPRAGGQDKYAGLPPAMRYVDMLLTLLG